MTWTRKIAVVAIDEKGEAILGQVSDGVSTESAAQVGSNMTAQLRAATKQLGLEAAAYVAVVVSASAENGFHSDGTPFKPDAALQQRAIDFVLQAKATRGTAHVQSAGQA
jgi:hypothetical protein